MTFCTPTRIHSLVFFFFGIGKWLSLTRPGTSRIMITSFQKSGELAGKPNFLCTEGDDNQEDLETVIFNSR